MNITNHWLRAEDIELDALMPDKRTALQALSHRLDGRRGDRSGDARAVFDALWQREQLGSTGVGHGVALPHARLEELTGPIAAFLRLQRPIAFDAPDNKPVTLVMALLLPRAEPKRQLLLLAHVAELFSSAQFREKVQRADSPEAVAKLFMQAM